jgi:hypothetical protein
MAVNRLIDTVQRFVINLATNTHNQKRIAMPIDRRRVPFCISMAVMRKLAARSASILQVARISS